MGAAFVAVRLARRSRLALKARKKSGSNNEMKKALLEMEKQVPALVRFLGEDTSLGKDFASMSPFEDLLPTGTDNLNLTGGGQTPVSSLNQLKQTGGLVRHLQFSCKKLEDETYLTLCTCNVDAGIACGLGISNNFKRSKQAAAVQVIERLQLVKNPGEELSAAGQEHDGAQKCSEMVAAMAKFLRNLEMIVLQPCGTTYKVFIQAEFQGRSRFGLSRLCDTMEEAIAIAGEAFYYQLRATLRIPKDSLHEPEAWAEALDYEASRQVLQLGRLGIDNAQAELADAIFSGEESEAIAAALQEAMKRQEARLETITQESTTVEADQLIIDGGVARRCWEVCKPEDEDWRREEVKGKLPAEQVRADISKALELNQVVVVSGGTGSGKSTQLPQFLLDDFREWKLELPEGTTEEPPELEEGATVEVEYEDVWYSCRILEVSEDKSTITAKYFDGGDEEPDIDVKTRVRKGQPRWAREKPRIVVTQPRRIAAISLAQRVAWERFGEVGGEIGHSVRGDTIVPNSEEGTVEFCTVGTLLRRLINDPLLRYYNVVMLDEVHERDLFTDFLLILVKEVVAKRPDLRLVLMSATLDVQTFTNYLPGCQVIEVPTGTRYPVEEIHLDDSFFNDFALTRALIDREAEARDSLGASAASAGQHEFGIGEDVDQSALKESLVEEVQMLIEADEDAEAKWEAHCEATLGGEADPDKHPVDSLRAFLSDVDDSEDRDKTPPSAVLAEQILQVASYSEQVKEAWVEYVANSDSDKPVQEWESSKLLAFLEAQGIRPWKVELASWEVTNSTPWWGGDTADKTFLKLTEELILKVAPQLLKEDPDEEYGVGSVLCFLPGWGEIRMLAERLENSFDAANLWVLRLHSSVEKQEQQQVFETAPEGKVKVILATNIAESSVTINDVRVVVDVGLHREVTYDPKKRMSSMETVWICQSNAVQRKGRAGRVREGRVFRLYSRDQFESVPWRPAPEIQRCNLAQTCLQTIALGRDPREFLARAPDPPMVANVESAMAELAGIEAIQDGVPPKMLPVGQVLSRLPLEPLLGRAMILGTLLGIPQTTAALLTASGQQSPFIQAPDRRAEMKEKRLEFCSWSDTVASLRALMEFEQIYKSRGEYETRQWADYFCLNFQRLLNLSRLRFQLLRDVQRSGLLDAAATEGLDPEEWIEEQEDGQAMWERESEGAIFDAGEQGRGMQGAEWLQELSKADREVEDERLLIGILCYAFPWNFAVRQKRGHFQLQTSSGSKAVIDMKSVNCVQESNREDQHSWLPEPSWWLYADMRMFNGQMCLSDTTYVSNWNLALFGGIRVQEKDGLELNGWIGVDGGSEKTELLVRRLRQDIRQSLAWVSIAASWDRIAMAAVHRSKRLLRALGRVLVGQRPDEEDLKSVREWRLPVLEEGGSTLGADEEVSRDEVEDQLMSKTVVELKVLLREMDAKVSGRKMELVKRCADYLMYGEERPEEEFEDWA